MQSYRDVRVYSTALEAQRSRQRRRFPTSRRPCLRGAVEAESSVAGWQITSTGQAAFPDEAQYPASCAMCTRLGVLIPRLHRTSMLLICVYPTHGLWWANFSCCQLGILFRPEFCLNDDSFRTAAVMPLAEPAGTLVRCKHVYLTPSRKGAGMYL